SVVQDLVREHGEPAVPRGKPFLAVFAELLADTQFQSLEPEVLEPARPAILTRPPEGMNVVLADVAPVLERDAELERALDGHHEIPLVDLQELMQREVGRDRGLADAHGADLVRLDQGDVEGSAEEPPERGRGHPPGGTAPGDDDLVNLAVHPDPYRLSLLISSARSLRAAFSSSGARQPLPGSGMCA